MKASAAAIEVPDHIPPELVWDHDFDEFCLEGDDPFLAASRMIDGPPLVWGTRVFFGKPAWIPTRYALIEEAFLNHEFFSSRRSDVAMGMLGGGGWRSIPLELDPPEHGKYRIILHPYFSPKSMQAMESMVQETCDSLIERFADKGGCEFIDDFAARLPNLVFLSMMGMPVAILDQFLEWEHGLLRGVEEEKRLEAAQNILGYFHGFIAEQREASTRTELMKTILAGKVDGEPLSDLELLGICFLLYVGGLDTVYSSLGWIFRQLALEPELQARLRANPGEIPKAVEEFERAFPVARPTRVVAKDCDFHGVSLRKGDTVVLPTYIAGRDPEICRNPHRIDIDRKAPYISFGKGPHFCLGVHLAKREIRIVLETILSRFNNIRIPAGAGYEYHVGGVFGVDRLPLVWD